MGTALNVLLVVNPIAGGGRGRIGGVELEARLQSAGCEVERYETDAPDAVARRFSSPGAVDGIDRIVCVGGDGTLNDVVNALPDPGAIPLGQFGLGTANMVSRELGIPRSAEGVAQVVTGGAVHRIDLGTANGRRFFGNASCGFDARLVHHIARRRKGGLGFFGYVLPGFASLRGYREPRLEVQLDGDAILHAGMVIVSNFKNYGGLFTVSPTAGCDSGTLELCAFERAGIPDLVRTLVAGALGRLHVTRGVALRRITRARIVSLVDPVPVQIDGDARGTSPLELSVQPAALPILVPRAL
jgi:diacylglycerol kinase (ATP)